MGNPLATLRRLHAAIVPYAQAKNIGHEGSELLEAICEARALLEDEGAIEAPPHVATPFQLLEARVADLEAFRRVVLGAVTRANQDVVADPLAVEIAQGVLSTLGDGLGRPEGSFVYFAGERTREDPTRHEG